MDIKELKKADWAFRKVSSDLLHTCYEDYSASLNKFLNCIDETPCIKEYAQNCIKEAGYSQQEIAEAVEEVSSNCCSKFFFESKECVEVAFVYLALIEIRDKGINVPRTIAIKYSNSNKLQDCTDSFNDRFVSLLVNHIIQHLAFIGIDMQKSNPSQIISITADHSQVNCASGDAEITATASFGSDSKEILELLTAIRTEAASLPKEVSEEVCEAVDMLKQQVSAGNPKPASVRLLLKALKAAVEGTNLMASVTTLVTLIASLL